MAETEPSIEFSMGTMAQSTSPRTLLRWSRASKRREGTGAPCHWGSARQGSRGGPLHEGPRGPRNPMVVAATGRASLKEDTGGWDSLGPVGSQLTTISILVIKSSRAILGGTVGLCPRLPALSDEPLGQTACRQGFRCLPALRGRHQLVFEDRQTATPTSAVLCLVRARPCRGGREDRRIWVYCSKLGQYLRLLQLRWSRRFRSAGGW